jgi:hypothetical protein
MSAAIAALQNAAFKPLHIEAMHRCDSNDRLRVETGAVSSDIVHL